MFFVHTSQEEFENGGFTPLKTYQMISVPALRRGNFRPHTHTDTLGARGLFLVGGDRIERRRRVAKRRPARRPLASRVTHGGFTLKTHQMFSVHTPEKFENPTITVGHFGFVFEENSVRKITTPSCSKCFLSTLKRKARVFKLLRFEERF